MLSLSNVSACNLGSKIRLLWLLMAYKCLGGWCSCIKHPLSGFAAGLMQHSGGQCMAGKQMKWNRQRKYIACYRWQNVFSSTGGRSTMQHNCDTDGRSATTQGTYWNLASQLWKFTCYFKRINRSRCCLDILVYVVLSQACSDVHGKLHSVSAITVSVSKDISLIWWPLSCKTG